MGNTTKIAVDAVGLPEPGVIATGGTDGTLYPDDRMLLKHDFMRRLSNTLFGSPHFVDLFSNENTVLEDLASKLNTSYATTVFDRLASNAIDDLDHSQDEDVSGNTNLGKHLLHHLI